MTVALVTIPPAILERIEAFLSGQKTGKIVLDVHQGRIMGGHAEEAWPRLTKEECAS